MSKSVVAAPSRKQNFRCHYGYVIVGSCFIIMVVVWGVFYSFGVFFKPVLEEFGWTRAMTSGAYSLALLLSGLLGVYVGGLNDRFGPRIVLTSCGVLLGLGYLLMASVHTIWQVYLFYGVIISLGMSGSFAPVASTVTRWFTRRRGIMMAIMVSGIGVGNIILPVLADRLISTYSWRVSFAAFGALSLVLIPAAAYFLRRSPADKGLLPYGESGAVAWEESPEASGFTFRQAIRTVPFWMLWIAFFSYGFNVQATMVHIVPHATDLGVSATVASGLLAVIGAVSIPGRVITGIVADRIGVRLSFVTNFSIMAFSMFWLTAASDLWMFYLFAAAFGLAYGGLAILNPVITADLFGLKAHGAIVGMITFGFQTGGALGPLLAGHIFDMTGRYYSAFLICGALASAGTLLAVLLKPAAQRGLSKISRSGVSREV